MGSSSKAFHHWLSGWPSHSAAASWGWIAAGTLSSPQLDADFPLAMPRTTYLTIRPSVRKERRERMATAGGRTWLQKADSFSEPSTGSAHAL